MKKQYDNLAGAERPLTKFRTLPVWRLVLLFAWAIALCDSNIALAQTVTRGPYLQLGTSTSIVIRWRTSAATNSRVRYGASPISLTNTVDLPAATTEHIVTLTGLAPDTLYYYSVGSTTQVLAGGDSGHFFVTAPPPGVAQPTRIWVIGDSGDAGVPGQGLKAAAVRNAYLNFTGTRHTDLWLMLGDNAYESGTDIEYQRAVFNMYPTLLRQSVVWPTLGNHDGETANSATQTGPYYDIFTLPKFGEAGGVASGTEAYYSFDFGNIHFIVLDSFDTSRVPQGAMLTWLTSDLAATTQPWIIAYWHHPPYSKGSINSDTDPRQKEMRENVLPILEAGGVDLVLTAHAQWYQRSYLIDGHYGLSSSFTAGMKVDGGSGRVDDTGAYEKPALDAPHKGAVYAIVGSSSRLSLNGEIHPAGYIFLEKFGSLVLDINGNRLDARFIDDTTGVVGDYFTMMKGGTTQKPQIDFDGDKKTDVGVYRNGAWFIMNSNGGNMVVGWGGAAQDVPVQADYDGDGKSDVTVFRDGVWFILKSSGGSQFVGWGTAGDVPVPGDYDGDGKTDVAVYRDGIWFILKSSGGSQFVGWGTAGDVPVPGDYDGDGKTDVAVYRNGIWFINNSSGGLQVVGWGGAAQDIPVPRDYDGDGKTDVAVYRDGIWFINNSSGGIQVVGWGGVAQDKPVPADYDGDGKTDVAVFRDGTWFINKSSGGNQVVGWGTAGDVPIN